MKDKTFYITTPIYYVNANPHIGHAYTQVVVDAVTRYHKMRDEGSFFLTGTDEHGEKIEEAAIQAGYKKGEEQKFVDSIVVGFKKAWEALDIEYDYFIRTTDKGHEKVVQDILNKMKDSGDIYQGEYDGWFCTPCETFWTDTQAEGGICPDCSRKVERLKEKNYFFKMSKHQEWLIDYIGKNPDFIMPSFRKNEVLGFLRENLNDLCISRPKDRMAWGVPLPFDTDYVVYVWFEALINYLSALEETNKEKFWPADFHVIAKDILRHHAVFWPIMLKCLGKEMPKTIFAHGWWKMGQEKMSKSKGNIVDPLDLVEKYGVDPLRYFLIKAVNFGMDGVFSEEALRTMYNSDLANDLGNLLNRTLTMVEKYFEGVSPGVDESKIDKEQLDRSSEYIKAGVVELFPLVEGYIRSSKLSMQEALEAIMSVVGKANKYIEESAPWKYSKEGKLEEIQLIMADLLEVLRVSSIGLFPFVPSTAQKMWRQLGLGELTKDGEVAPIVKQEIEERIKNTTGKTWRKFPSGVKVAKGDPLFPRLK